MFSFCSPKQSALASTSALFVQFRDAIRPPKKRRDVHCVDLAWRNVIINQ
jgi:hypothetical protein